MKHVVHHTPGRMRVRIPELIGRPGKIREICDLVGKLEGVDEVLPNEMTGSIVVRYHEGLPVHRNVLSVLAENDCYDASRAITHDEYIRDAVVSASRKVSKTVAGWAFGKAVEDAGFALLTALI